MKTRNAMQLKALINNKAKAAGVSPQLMLQSYMLERLIDRIEPFDPLPLYLGKGSCIW